MPRNRGRSSVEVHRPSFVPAAYRDTWFTAAQRVASAGLLHDEKGQVDYPTITKAYKSLRKASVQKSNRTASVKVYRPTHVPLEAKPFWEAAAKRLNRVGSLVKANGKVDYLAVNSEYQKLLGHLGRVASQVGTKVAIKKHSISPDISPRRYLDETDDYSDSVSLDLDSDDDYPMDDDYDSLDDLECIGDECDLDF